MIASWGKKYSFLFFSWKSILLIPVFWGLTWVAYTQSGLVSLKKEKSEKLLKIKEASKRLESVSSQRRKNMGELSLIRQRLYLQKRIIGEIELELIQLDSTIAASENLIYNLKSDLNKLRDEYGAMLYAASKTSFQINRLNAVFAAQNINELYHRVRYFQQYQATRKTQVNKIEELREELRLVVAESNQQKEEKLNLLRDKRQQAQKLNQLESQQFQMIRNLSEKESELKKELKQEQENLRKLEQLITSIVREKDNPAANAPTRKAAPIAPAVLTKKFTRKRGALAWPVAQGFISTRFGRQEHPVLEGVKIDNAGIDIQVVSSKSVRAVYDGQVATVADIPGMKGKVIMVQHGDYFTVYAGIGKIRVNPGDWVSERQSIAEVVTDAKGISRLQFQIWKKSNKLNPEGWLHK